MLLSRKDDEAFATATQKAPGGDMDPWDALDGIRLIDLPTAAPDFARDRPGVRDSLSLP